MDGRTKDIELAHGAAKVINRAMDAGVKFTDEQTYQVLDQTEKEIGVERNRRIYDKMTGLFSSDKFEEDGKKMVGPNLGVIVVDIGHLGYANDRLGGHAAGDKYKKRVAEIVGGKTEEMQKFQEETGVVFEGYMLTKGDEMGILMQGSRDQAEAVAAKIRQEVNGLGKITPDSELKASVSIGVAIGGEFSEDLDRFLNQNKDLEKSLTVFKFLGTAATFRSEMDKIRERLSDMVEWLKNSEKFESLYPYLAKNAIGIDRKLLAQLAESSDYGADSEALIRGVMRRRKENELYRATDPLQRLEIEMELKILEGGVNNIDER